MVEGHKINKKVSIKEFIEIIKSISKEDLDVTDHALFRIMQKDRESFKEYIIKELILNENPILVGIQNNGLYTVYYKKDKEITKLIIEVKFNKLNIVTVYKIREEQIPKI